MTDQTPARPCNLKPRVHKPKTDHEVFVYDFIGRRIKLGRKMLNLTQANLGAEIGITHQQIQKWELGLQRIPAYRLHQIATTLNKPHQWFFPCQP